MTNPLIQMLIDRYPDAAEYLSDLWVDDLEMLIDDIDTRSALATRFGCSPATITRLAQHYIPLASA